jgi:tetratricopeptide (TPR) repeat protein
MSQGREPSSPSSTGAPDGRLRWPPGATTFVFFLLLLLVAAIVPTVRPAKRVEGLPDDPDVASARELMNGRMSLPGASLRFESALTGEAATGHAAPGDGARLIEARDRLEQARAHHHGDARLDAALAAVEVARHRYASAERQYRRALDRASNYPEARLGLGVTLAMLAELERSTLGARGLMLKAIAQFAAVEPDASQYEEALYNRALLLARVGRVDEARQRARRYLEMDATSPWADTMRRVVATLPRARG